MSIRVELLLPTPRRIYLLRRAKTLAPNSSNREYEFGANVNGPEFPF